MMRHGMQSVISNWFLVGEGKLEEYLEEFPAKEENVREAKSCLERIIQV